MISDKIFYIVPIDSPDKDIIWHVAKVMRRFSLIVHILPNLETKDIFEGCLVDINNDDILEIVSRVVSAKRPITLARNSFAIGIIDESKLKKISMRKYFGCAWNTSSTAILVNWYGCNQVCTTFLHELGHLVGISGHCNNGKCIMSQKSYRNSFCEDCQDKFDRGLREERSRSLSLIPIIDSLNARFLKFLLPKV